MSDLIKTIFYVETNELEIRPMTEDELAQQELDAAEAKSKADLQAKEAANKIAAKAKLVELGLTIEDLKVLGLA